MSAEHQKILWIIASIAFVIVVVLAAGFWWLYPGTRAPDTAAVAVEPAASGTGAVDALSDWVRPEETAPQQGRELQNPMEGPVVIVINNDGTVNADGGAVESAPADPLSGTAPVELQPSAPGPGTALNEPAPSAVKPSAPAAAVPKPAPETVKPAPAPVKAKPAQAKPVKVSEYWIQTASVSSISGAEEVKSLLLEKGLAAVIIPVVVNEKRFYRVRVGPYANKPEAEKFLEWIRKVKGLEKSYVSLVSRTR